MTSTMLQVQWINTEQAHASLNRTVVPWAKKLLKDGHALVAEFRLAEDHKTDKQRKYFHGVILTEIARKAKVNGERFDFRTWKEFFRKEYLGFKTVTTINPMTGKKSRNRVRVSTEDLGVKAYSNYIDRVTAFAVTELGVEFSVKRWEDYQVDPDTGEIFQ
mgnify:CR=1 FL=1